MVEVRPRNASREVGRRGTSERLQSSLKMELEMLVVRRKERGRKSVQRLEQSLWPGLRWPSARTGSVLTRAWFFGLRLL